jgi:putative tricarboxylic transport membrane protein
VDIVNNLIYGLGVCVQPMNLFYCFVGVFFGTLVGVLPGLGPVASMSLLLPVTFHLPPVGAIIMLAGIYYGCMYGGSTTSILVNIPGEAASVVTCLDGYQMARKGRAGPALGMAAFGSFIAGTLSTIGLMLVAPSLAKVALKFGPPEYCSLMLLGFTILGYLARGSIIKALMMAAFGLILGTVGMDIVSGKMRFTYDLLVLEDGLGLVPVVMGIFGVSEVLLNVETAIKQEVFRTKIRDLMPNLQDWKDSLWPILRGSVIGFFMGILPGPGPVVASYASYAVEKKISKRPNLFGTGVIEGVAGPESANNAATSGSFVPMLALGIPSNAVMALLLGAMIIYGLHPGPFLIKQSPDLFWGMIASMYVGNIMLLVLNLPLIGLWVRILKVPYPILFPLVLLFCLVGSYSINNSIGDVLVMNFFGIIGYLMKKFKFEGAPLILAFVLGPMFENALRQSLMLAHGSFLIFFNRPISLGFLIVVSILLISAVIARRRPAEGLEDEEI